MTAPTLAQLKIKRFTDVRRQGANRRDGQAAVDRGIHYQSFIAQEGRRERLRKLCARAGGAVPDRHISFEVFSDDVSEMVAQARVIATLGKNVYVKLPVTNTRGEPLFEAVRALSRDGVNINMTAIFTS